MKHRELFLIAIAATAFAQPKIIAPRIWNDRDLAEWATRLANLNVRPGYLSEKEYYTVPVGDWVRSYPVYFGAGSAGDQRLGFRTTDPTFIAKIRSAEELTRLGRHARKDGTVFGWRWVPTSSGIALSISECSGCHARSMPDGRLLDGAQGDDETDDLFFEVLQPAKRSSCRATRRPRPRGASLRCPGSRGEHS
jgi:hypothetical protein